MVLCRLGCREEAEALLRDTLALNPLDVWARHLRGDRLGCDLQARLERDPNHALADLAIAP